jgi:hypothetical protein
MDLHSLQLATAYTKSSRSAVSSTVSYGNGFQRRILCFLWIPQQYPLPQPQQLSIDS